MWFNIWLWAKTRTLCLKTKIGSQKHRSNEQFTLHANCLKNVQQNLFRIVKGAHKHRQFSYAWSPVHARHFSQRYNKILSIRMNRTIWSDYYNYYGSRQTIWIRIVYKFPKFLVAKRSIPPPIGRRVIPSHP